MNEIKIIAGKSFSAMGLVYTAMSVVVTVLQYAVLWLLSKVLGTELFTTNVQIITSSTILYVVGFLILNYGMKKQGLRPVKLEKYSMSVGDLLKAFCMCYAVLIVSNMIGLLLTNMIGMLKGSPVVNPVETLAAELSLPILFIFTVICAPIFEELFFRKFVIDRMVSYGELPAVLVSGFMFGLFHGNLSQFPYAFTIGIFFGFLYVRTGHIIYPMLLHAMVNFFGSVAATFVVNGMDQGMMNSILSATAETDIFSLITAEGIMSLVALLVYELVIMILVIVGIILWILNIKRFVFFSREMDIPRGSRFMTVLGNPGMLAYTLGWLGMIIFSLI